MYPARQSRIDSGQLIMARDSFRAGTCNRTGVAFVRLGGDSTVPGYRLIQIMDRSVQLTMLNQAVIARER
jgi:hypothetical protein